MRNATAVDRSKYQIVSALCDMAEKNNIIKKIIVFGSAASKKCSMDSDIDSKIPSSEKGAAGGVATLDLTTGVIPVDQLPKVAFDTLVNVADVCYDLSCSVTDSRARNLSVTTAKICDYNCDIVYYELIGANLRKEIEDKGVVVYES